MLEHIEHSATPRQLRLFACGCCRLVWNRLPDTSQNAVVTAERFADSIATYEQMVKAIQLAPVGKKFGGSWISHNSVQVKPHAQAKRTVQALAIENPFDAAWEAAKESMTLVQIEQCDVLRDILPNPFRPLPDDKTIRLDSVRTIADEIYNGNHFDQIPKLGELLESVGCKNINILEHCASQLPHVRGCWLIDLIRALA